MTKFNLVELSNSYIRNLVNFGSPVIIGEIIKYSYGTPIYHHKKIYEYSLEFYKNSGKFPSEELVKELFPVDFIPSGLEPNISEDLVRVLLYQVKKSYVTSKSVEALTEGDFDKVKVLVSSIKPEKESDPYTMDKALEDYDRRQERPVGILSRVSELDDKLKGMSYSNLHIIAGPPSSGKSLFAKSLLYNAVHEDGYNMVLISLEVSEMEIMFNLLSRHSATMGRKLSAESITKGLLNEEERKYLTEVKEDFDRTCKGQFRVLTSKDVDDWSEEGLNHLFSKIDQEFLEESKRRNPDKEPVGLDGFILDYVQLVSNFRPKGVDKKDYCNDFIGYCNDLVINFKGKGLIGILLSQVNREGERKLRKTKVATMDMLAELNALERYGYTITIIFSTPVERANNTIFMQVVKNRGGGTQTELFTTYADYTSNLVGSSEFKEIFTEQTLDDLGLDSNGDDLFT